jgi:hypothetical protein
MSKAQSGGGFEDVTDPELLERAAQSDLPCADVAAALLELGGDE